MRIYHIALVSRMSAILFALVAICTSAAYACEEPPTPLALPVEEVICDKCSDNSQSYLYLGLVDTLDKKAEQQLTEMKQLLASEKNTFDKKINTLENLVNSQALAIEALRLQGTQKSASDDMSFVDFSSILLTAVAVIVATLGAVIAIFAIIGYRKMKETAERIATTAATNITPEVAQQEVIKQMESGGFNSILADAVERVALRGIISGPEYDEDTNNGN